MAFDRFLIAPLNTGLETDVKPWLIPDDAFAELQNAYVFRGRVRKRFGSYVMNGSVADSIAQQYSRLRIKIGTTDNTGTIAGTVPGAIFKIGQLFSIGDAYFTVTATGTPANLLRSDGVVSTATYNTTTGAYVISGASALTDVFFYPAEPVMGFINYEVSAINNEPTYAFDTQFSYQFTSGAWTRLGTALWTGGNADFFWGWTYRGTAANNNLLFVSNYHTADQIKYWDGASWTTINPVFNSSGDTIESARLIVPFKNRLLFFNTIEKISGVANTFLNRARFSQNGSPIASDAWREDIPGRGGYLDAPTQEAIITCQFLKDRLIVFFESSTWEFVYTGNEVLPFRWQQINTELGCESTFSVVPFDKVILGVGNVGIHACNGSNVERIDEKIPQAVFDIHNENDGVVRVNGIRDYYLELVYWSFPASQWNPTFPTRVLVYNYRTGSWAFNDDCITCFGYFQNTDDQTWAATSSTWEQQIEEWDDGELQAQFKQIIGGNQQGFTFIVNADESRNAPSLQITNITYTSSKATVTVLDNNLFLGDYVVFENVQGITGLNGKVFPAIPNVPVPNNVFTIKLTNADGTPITLSGSYTGGGTLARVSEVSLLTKQYNFYLQQGRNAYVEKVGFFVDKTDNGEMQVDYFTSSSTESLVESGAVTGTLLGTSVLETSPYDLYPLEQTQARLWHPVYLQADGESVQLQIYLNDAQLRDTAIAWSDFELNALLFYARPTSMNLL